MIRINNLKLPLDADFTQLKQLCAKALRLAPQQVISARLCQQIDRRTPQGSDPVRLFGRGGPIVR